MTLLTYSISTIFSKFIYFKANKMIPQNTEIGEIYSQKCGNYTQMLFSLKAGPPVIL